MDTDNNFLYKELTRIILEAAFEVHNYLGCCLLEKIYENAIIKEIYNISSVNLCSSVVKYFKRKSYGF